MQDLPNKPFLNKRISYMEVQGRVAFLGKANTRKGDSSDIIVFELSLPLAKPIEPASR